MAEDVQAELGLQKELNELEDKISPATPEDKNGGGDENLIIEKDGELYLRSESDEAEPVADPDEGQAAEQDSPAASEEGEQAVEKEPSQFQGKSRDDLIQMVAHSQKKIR